MWSASNIISLNHVQRSFPAFLNALHFGTLAPPGKLEEPVARADRKCSEMSGRWSTTTARACTRLPAPPRTRACRPVTRRRVKRSRDWGRSAGEVLVREARRAVPGGGAGRSGELRWEGRAATCSPPCECNDFTSTRWHTILLWHCPHAPGLAYRDAHTRPWARARTHTHARAYRHRQPHRANTYTYVDTQSHTHTNTNGARLTRRALFPPGALFALCPGRCRRRRASWSCPMRHSPSPRFYLLSCGRAIYRPNSPYPLSDQ